jgi:hypothetical protein
MTNEQCNAIIRAIFAASPISWGDEEAEARKFLLPIEPPASVEVEGPGAGYRWLLIGELCQKGDQYHDGDGWGNTYRTTPVPRARQYRRKIDAKDGGA